LLTLFYLLLIGILLVYLLLFDVLLFEILLFEILLFINMFFDKSCAIYILGGDYLLLYYLYLSFFVTILLS